MRDGTRSGKYDIDFIRRIPKSDLHVHLDGSLRLPTLIELAKEGNVSLPSYTVEGMRELVFKKRYRDLSEYLYGFRFTVAVMQNPEALERVAYELAQDNLEEGVKYIEVRFAPQLHINRKQNMLEVLRAVNRGLDRAKSEYNRRPEVRSGRVPPFEYGIITSAIRKFDASYSAYYAQLFDVHCYSEPRDIFAIASLELAKAVVRIRDSEGLPIVGFDLCGEEAGFPAEHHWEAFDFAHRNFLKKTVHAGEAYGPESIFQAITDLKADRIGHGYYLFSAGSVSDQSIEDRNEYVRMLSEYIADRRITIEVCLTSNLQTNPRIRNISSHAFKKMRQYNLSTTFCTDNRLVSNTTVTNEVYLAATAFHLQPRELKDIIIYGFKRSFFPGSYIDKRKYVRRIIDYYETIEQEYVGSVEPKD